MAIGPSKTATILIVLAIVAFVIWAAGGYLWLDVVVVAGAIAVFRTQGII